MINAIGIPLLNKSHEPNDRNDALLKAAYLYGVPAYIYDIADIPSYIKTGSISAVYWDGGEYKIIETDLPKYTEIYCAIFPLRQLYPKECQWLSNNTIITDGFGLPKQTFQNKLLFSDLSAHAIPTIPIRSYQDLVSQIATFPVSFLKPIGGSKAVGSMKLSFKDGQLFYSTPEDSGELTEAVFSNYYSSCGYDGSILLLEPYINIVNDDGRAVDFRCLVSLNGEGKWQNVLTYARIGGTDVASNFSHGGSLNFAEEVLESLAPGHGAEKLEEINQIALKAAALVQRESVNNVSWLGLDICMDRPSNQIYVIEANSKPGTKLVGPWPLSLVRAQYFKYILENGIPEK